jgi:hypothetical protein
MQSKYIKQSEYNQVKIEPYKLNLEGKVETSKPESEDQRFVALVQYKNEERRAVILKEIPTNKNHMKVVLLQAIQESGLGDDAQLGDVVLVDKSQIPLIEDWVNFKIGISEVIEKAHNSMMNPKVKFNTYQK